VTTARGGFGRPVAVMASGFGRPVAVMVAAVMTAFAVAATLPLASARADSRLPPPEQQQGPALPLAGAQPHPLRSGTAFFVSADGKMLTSAHVVTACTGITLWPPGAPARRAKVLAVDTKADLAVLQSRGHVPAIAEIDISRPVSAGTALMTVGFATHLQDPRMPEVTTGSMIQDNMLTSGPHVLIIAAALSPGNSGGPVVDAVGTVRGIVIGSYTARPDQAIAVAADELAPLLARAGVAAPHNADTAPAVVEKDRTAQLLAMSALVQCSPTGRHGPHSPLSPRGAAPAP
jgi:S1-C subfamily serine protease